MNMSLRDQVGPSIDHLEHKAQFVLRNEIVFMLVVWYCLYTQFDTFSTYWLISHSPVGIAGERNPLGAVLFLQEGLAGALVAKLLATISVFLAIIYVETRFTALRNVVKGVMLFLVSTSLLVFVLDSSSIIATLFSH